MSNIKNFKYFKKQLVVVKIANLDLLGEKRIGDVYEVIKEKVKDTDRDVAKKLISIYKLISDINTLSLLTSGEYALDYAGLNRDITYIKNINDANKIYETLESEINILKNLKVKKNQKSNENEYDKI